MNKFKRNIVIIGASSSIGHAVVKNFQKNGDKVIATFNKNKPQTKYSSVRYKKLDLSSKSSIKTFAKSNRARPSVDKEKKVWDLRKLFKTNTSGKT